jgi:hypothetical protein
LGDQYDSGESHDRSKWINDDGRIVHPNAPQGWGGLGRFRFDNSLGRDPAFYPPVSHHQSAAARYRILTEEEKKALRTRWTLGNPPPVTVAATHMIRGAKVIILDDGTTSDTAIDAKTGLAIASLVIPGTRVKGPRGDPTKRKVIELLGPIPVTTFTIQTVYGPGATARGISGYGRGTTWDDKENGDLTLGFHESCHREDILKFIREVSPPPVFTGRVGMTEAEYDKAKADFSAALTSYKTRVTEYTVSRTDEVGSPTKTEYLAAKNAARQPSPTP